MTCPCYALIGVKAHVFAALQSETTLLDLGQLDIVQKSVRPLEKQDPMETRKFWEPVTNAIIKKDYKQATAHKQTIEQAQRDKAAAREKSGERCVSQSAARQD